MDTGRTVRVRGTNRPILRSSTGREYYVLPSGGRRYVNAAPAAAGSSVNGRKWIVSHQGQIRRPNGTRIPLTPNQVNEILTRAAVHHPGHLHADHVPYVTRASTLVLPNDPRFERTNESINSNTRPGYSVRVYFNRTNGRLHYRKVNGHFVPSNSAQVPHHIRMFPRVYNNMHAFLAMFHNGFPAVAAPPAPAPAPEARRTNAQLLNNMTQQIFARGPINVTRYSNNEKNRLAVKLLERMKASKNKYKRNKAAGVNENIYGQYINQAKAYYRGYRAVKPLSGSIKSPRRWNVTPNRGTPAPGSMKNFVTFNTLEKPHIVVKRKGTETFYINPETLRNFIKAGSGANIKNTNLRHWLRSARKTRPSEKLFPHPTSKTKFVRPKNIRFSRT
jgi:hypothetical protein